MYFDLSMFNCTFISWMFGHMYLEFLGACAVKSKKFEFPIF